MCQVYLTTRIAIMNNIYINVDITKYNLIQIRIRKFYISSVNCMKRHQHNHNNFSNVNKINTVALIHWFPVNRNLGNNE